MTNLEHRTSNLLSPPLERAEFLRVLEQTGAVQTGHFLLSSGRHSPQYIQCARLLQHPYLAERTCAALAHRFLSDHPQVVIAPAMGGIIVAHEVARALGVRAIFAERVDGRFAIRRSLTIAPGERVLIVEDVVTTGGSTREVADIVAENGGQIVGIGALVDRTGGARVPWRFEALIGIEVPTYEPGACPQCALGLPAAKPGSRSVLATAR